MQINSRYKSSAVKVTSEEKLAATWSWLAYSAFFVGKKQLECVLCVHKRDDPDIIIG